MTLLPSLAQIAAPLLQHDPLHRWAARTNQLNLTWGKRRIWERVSSPRYAAAQQVHFWDEFYRDLVVSGLAFWEGDRTV